MSPEKIKLLEYIHKNYDNVVKPTKEEEYIEVDLIPGSHDGLHELTEILEYCNKNDIDVTMFIRSYPMAIGDGIRMGRYFYFMQETSKEILTDLNKLN